MGKVACFRHRPIQASTPDKMHYVLSRFFFAPALLFFAGAFGAFVATSFRRLADSFLARPMPPERGDSRVVGGERIPGSGHIRRRPCGQNPDSQ